MPEYTIRIVQQQNYHLQIRSNSFFPGGITIPDLNNNGQFTQTFDNDTAFKAYVDDLSESIASGLYTDTTRLEIRLGLTSDDDEDDDYDDLSDYTYVTVRYAINGQEATITVTDAFDDTGEGRDSLVINASPPVTLNIQLEGPLRRNVIFRDIYDIFVYDDNIVESDNRGSIIFENSSDIRDVITAKVGQIENFILDGVGWERDQVIDRLWQSTPNPNLNYNVVSDINWSLLESENKVTATITGTIDDPRVAIPVSYTHLTLPTNREV